MKKGRKDTTIIVNEMKKQPVKITYLKAVLKKYQKKGYNFNSKYYQGKTLLHYAIEYEHNKLIKVLVKYGCNPDICDDNFTSPLHLAITKGNIKAIKLLIKYGADIDICGEFVQTPLHLATIIGNLDLVKLLINKGSDYTLVDEHNLSILDYAKDEKNISALYIKDFFVYVLF